MIEKNNLITARNLADELGLSIETIWRYTREKRIPYIELGNKQYRYRLAEVIDALSIKEQPSNYEAEEDRIYTYQDYQNIPEDPGYHHEILEGILIKEPSPNVKHQRILRRLYRILEDYFKKHDPKGEIFFAPLDVTFEDITVVQPDLLYVSGTQNKIIKDNRIDGAPNLIVEIVSSTSRRRDRLQKLQIYQKAEVEHYWLVSPEEETLECFYLNDGLYSLIFTGMDKDVIEHPVFTGLNFSLKTLWEGRL